MTPDSNLYLRQCTRSPGVAAMHGAGRAGRRIDLGVGPARALLMPDGWGVTTSPHPRQVVSDDRERSTMGFKSKLAGALGAGILMLGVPTAVLAYQPPVVPAIHQEGQGTYENMIAALGNLSAELEQLNATTDLTITNVRIFDADYLASGHDPAALDQAVAAHGAEIQNVQGTLANHEIVRTVLDMVNVPVERVVALDTLDAGDVAIYYQP
jgi:hypothetical protein